MVATSQRPPATDYVAIELASGKRITITNTCAANVLGLIKPEYFAYGNANAARTAMKPLADYMGKTVEEVATQILTRAYEKIEPVITDLAGKYRLEKDQISLVGVGGGAALAMVRDVVERVVPNPTPEDIRSIKAEAINKAVLCKAASYRNVVSQLWEELAIYQQDAILRPDYYICAGARVMDFSGSVDLDKIMMLMEVEMQMIDPNDDVIIVGAKNSL